MFLLLLIPITQRTRAQTTHKSSKQLQKCHKRNYPKCKNNHANFASLFYKGDHDGSKDCGGFEGYETDGVFFTTKKAAFSYFENEDATFDKTWKPVKMVEEGSANRPIDVNCRDMKSLVYCIRFKRNLKDAVESKMYKCTEKRMVTFPEGKIGNSDLLYLKDVVEFYSCDSLRKSSETFKSAVLNADIEESVLAMKTVKDIRFFQKSQ